VVLIVFGVSTTGVSAGTSEVVTGALVVFFLAMVFSPSLFCFWAIPALYRFRPFLSDSTNLLFFGPIVKSFFDFLFS
jgi:hypothetical protein